MTTSSSSPVLSWSFTENALSRSTSSPQSSMRTGESSVEPNTSRIAPRRANSPRCSASCSRTYPHSTSVLVTASTSMVEPLRTTSGSNVRLAGLRRCKTARIGATISCGASCRSRATKRIRSPIVSIAGLTRSNGSVSHEGKNSTSQSAYARRSSHNVRACVSVGVTTSRTSLGRERASAAMSIGLTWSAHATTDPGSSPMPRSRPRLVTTSVSAASESCSASIIERPISRRSSAASPSRHRASG